jgi:hypothetical protein
LFFFWFFLRAFFFVFGFLVFIGFFLVFCGLFFIFYYMTQAAHESPSFSGLLPSSSGSATTSAFGSNESFSGGNSLAVEVSDQRSGEGARGGLVRPAATCEYPKRNTWGCGTPPGWTLFQVARARRRGLRGAPGAPRSSAAVSHETTCGDPGATHWVATHSGSRTGGGHSSSSRSSSLGKPSAEKLLLVI